MINFHRVAKKKKTKTKKQCKLLIFLIQIPDHLYRILITGGSKSGKTNTLINLISCRPDIGKTYIYAKDPYEAKYQLLINKREGACLKEYVASKPLIKYSNNVDNICRKIEEYNLGQEHKTLIIFHYMIANILSNKTLDSIITELFIRGRKLNIYFAFMA